MVFQVPLPPKWETHGMLPPFDPQDGPVDSEWLNEDIWQARSPDRRFILDVSWFPESDPTGSYYCRLIENEDWDSPVEGIKTRSTVAVAAWANHTAVELGARVGAA